MEPDTERWSRAEKHLGAADPVMRALVARHGPCRLAPGTDLFAALCRSITSQQLSVKAAATIFGRFEALYPNGLTPRDVLDTPEEALRGAGFSRAKCAYVRDLAARVLDGSVDLGALHDLPDEGVIAALTTVKGIGRWTAEMILMFQMNRPDVLPVDDLGIREGFKRAYGLPERPAAPAMIATAEPWRPWRTVGSWYIWRALDAVPLTAEPTDGPAPRTQETL